MDKTTEQLLIKEINDLKEQLRSANDRLRDWCEWSKGGWSVNEKVMAKTHGPVKPEEKGVGMFLSENFRYFYCNNEDCKSVLKILDTTPVMPFLEKNGWKETFNECTKKYEHYCKRCEEWAHVQNQLASKHGHSRQQKEIW